MSIIEAEFDTDKISILIRDGEGLTVEFKEHYSPRIDQDIVAFSNTRGGTLILGVRDNGTISAEKLTNDLKAKINDLARNCKPMINVAISQVDNIVAIEVKEGYQKPYSCSSGYYRRLNGATQKMSHEELKVMFLDNDFRSFEVKTVPNFTFDDISKSKIKFFAKEANINLGRTTIVDFLRSLNVADESQVNNAGIMFFANDVYRFIHQSQINLVAFKGTERLYIYDRREVRDDLLTQFNEAMDFIKRHLNVRSEIRGVNRYDIYEIPLEVLREAIVNAIVHRDYNITGTQISVEIYDDRIEIMNPGGLHRGLTISKLGSVSLRRNEIIADLFYRLDKVERMGMGVKKMRTAMIEAGLRKPKFDIDTFFKVTFYRSAEFSLKHTDILAQKPAQKPAQKIAQKIIELITLNPKITRSELADSIGVSDNIIKHTLKKMQIKELIRRVGPDKGGFWEIL